MSLITANRVREACSASGTQSLTLIGAISGFATFTSKIQAGSLVPYVLLDGNGVDWECGFGTLVSATELARTTVIDSSATVDRVNNTAPGTPVKLSLTTNQHEVFVGVHHRIIFQIDENGNIVDPSPLRAAIFCELLANMTAMASLNNKESVFVLGGTSINDGKGGLFYWDSADAAAGDGIDTFDHDTIPTGLFKRVRIDAQRLGKHATFANADATPSIGGGGTIFTTTGSTTITDFDDAAEFQTFTVRRGSADITILNDPTKIDCGGASVLLTARNPHAYFVHYNGIHRLIGGHAEYFEIGGSPSVDATANGGRRWNLRYSSTNVANESDFVAQLMSSWDGSANSSSDVRALYARGTANVPSGITLAKYDTVASYLYKDGLGTLTDGIGGSMQTLQYAGDVTFGAGLLATYRLESNLTYVGVGRAINAVFRNRNATPGDRAADEAYAIYAILDTAGPSEIDFAAVIRAHTVNAGTDINTSVGLLTVIENQSGDIDLAIGNRFQLINHGNVDSHYMNWVLPTDGTAPVVEAFTWFDESGYGWYIKGRVSIGADSTPSEARTIIHTTVAETALLVRGGNAGSLLARLQRVVGGSGGIVDIGVGADGTGSILFNNEAAGSTELGIDASANGVWKRGGSVKATAKSTGIGVTGALDVINSAATTAFLVQGGNSGANLGRFQRTIGGAGGIIDLLVGADGAGLIKFDNEAANTAALGLDSAGNGVWQRNGTTRATLKTTGLAVTGVHEVSGDVEQGSAKRERVIKSSVLDDIAFSVQMPSSSCGTFEFMSTTQATYFRLVWDTVGTNQIFMLEEQEAAVIIDYTTGPLANAGGTDGHLIASIHTDGKIYISNRSGGTMDYLIVIQERM